MNRRRVIIGLFALVICVVLAASFWPEKPEPVYEGKKLSDWVLEADNNSMRGDTPSPVRRAIKAVGTNGYPFYLQWLRQERRAPGQLIHRLITWSSTLVGRPPVDREEMLRNSTVLAFSILGEQAGPLIPALCECITNANSPKVQSPALCSLAFIGHPAGQSFAALMTNANRDVRMMTLGYARLLGANNAVQDGVKRALEDPDATVRKTATNVAVDILPNFPRTPRYQ